MLNLGIGGSRKPRKSLKSKVSQLQRKLDKKREKEALSKKLETLRRALRK